MADVGDEAYQRETALLNLIAINGYAAYRNTCVGDPAPRVREEFERSILPQPGDLVLEITGRWYTGDSDGIRWALGYLLRVTQEPVQSRDDFQQMHAEGDYWKSPDERYEDIPTEDVWYIKPLDGRLESVRWRNCSFIRIHTTLPPI